MEGLVEFLHVIANILLIASVAGAINEFDRKYKAKKAAKKAKQELDNKQDKNE